MKLIIVNIPDDVMNGKVTLQLFLGCAIHSAHTHWCLFHTSTATGRGYCVCVKGAVHCLYDRYWLPDCHWNLHLFVSDIDISICNSIPKANHSNILNGVAGEMSEWRSCYEFYWFPHMVGHSIGNCLNRIRKEVLPLCSGSFYSIFYRSRFTSE